MASNQRKKITTLVDAKARECSVNYDNLGRQSALNGIDFELQCQNRLSSQGWSARLTPATGDQGADIVADKGKTSIVLQCKLYAKPVGNKVVQEVTAARAYYGADLAAVVATVDYTEAARQLARRNDVHLLHVDDLHDLERRLSNPAARSRAPERG